MRKLVYAINTTLDGCVDHTKFYPTEETMEFFTRLTQEADTFLYGRKTYELMVPYWPDVAKEHPGQDDRGADIEFARAFDAVEKIVVFSQSLDSTEGEKTTIVSTSLRDEVLKLKQEEGKNIFTGGVALASQLAELGLIDDARKLLHSLPPINGSTDIPVAMADVGEGLQAEAILRQNLVKFPDDTLWQNVKGPQIRVAIAMSRHKPEEAIEALRPGLPYDMRSFTLPAMRGRAYLAARQPSLAAIEFHKIIDHPTIEPLSHELPLAHLGLARADALLGDLAGSRAEYERVFALWKDADPDLPVLKDAHLEYARLRR